MEKKKNTIFVKTAPFEIIQKSSVELKRNSKGDTEIRIKVYEENISEAKKKAEEIYNQLLKKYPMS